MDITVSLISHNSSIDLAKLLPSLEVSLKDIHSEILLVDNCSTDATIPLLKKHYSHVRVKRNLDRLGYGANHNQNLSKARGSYVLFMNADIVVEKTSIRKLLNFMKKNPKVGIVAPKVLNEDGSLQFLNKRYPSITDLLLRRFCPKQFTHLFKKRMDFYEMRDVGYDNTIDVPFLSGSFMLCKTQLIKKIGGFDERYFLYFEDVDLCRRVQKTHRTVYYPNAEIIHRWDRAAHKSLKSGIIFTTSAFRYFCRWGFRFT